MMQMLTAMVILLYNNTVETVLKNLFMHLQQQIADLEIMEFLEKVVQNMKVIQTVEHHILIVGKFITMFITLLLITKDQL